MVRKAIHLLVQRQISVISTGRPHFRFGAVQFGIF